MSEKQQPEQLTNVEKREKLGQKIIQIAVDADGRLYALTNGGYLAYTNVNGHINQKDEWTVIDIPEPGVNVKTAGGQPVDGESTSS